MRRETGPLFSKVAGPLATLRVCNFCKHVETVRHGGIGRGYGMREGNKARGRMIQHVKAQHPAELAAALAKTTGGAS